MKRIQLFEFEDLHWFPSTLRNCLTRLLNVVHRLTKTEEALADLLAKKLKEKPQNQIIDLCSGGGGAMPGVVKELKEQHGFENIQLTMTDLYPNLPVAKVINEKGDNIHYHTQSVDATAVDSDLQGLRTMICSFHHMPVPVARKIVASAFQHRQDILIFEISDNSFPFFLWWTAIPVNIISCFFLTFMVRPFTWQQFVFTYLIPILPLCFAWDGAVSNARTYTMNDLDVLLEGLHADDYVWEKGVIKGRGRKLYLMGKAVIVNSL